MSGSTLSRVARFAAALVLAGASTLALAQTPPYGAPISLEQAKKSMAAAEAEARKNSWPVAIVIVDTGGHMVMMQKLDNTQNASIEIATGKATTAVNFKRPTKALQDVIAGGGAGMRILGVRTATPLEGGIPIVVDGKMIGGIGVSGVNSDQDAQVATAGLNALK